MGSLKSRVKRLEEINGDLECLTGVLFFHESLIYVDGIAYRSIEDIPDALRMKYPASLMVGAVSDEHGHTKDILA